MIYLVLLLCCFTVAAFFAASPFLKTHAKPAELDRRQQLYKQQIVEIDEEETNGLISSTEAEALRLEAQRRILAATPSDLPEKDTAMPLTRPTTALIISGMVLVSGTGLYALLGSPTTVSQNNWSRDSRSGGTELQQQSSRPAQQTAAQQSTVDSVDTMIGQLETRLAAQPDDVEGWRMLGWSYFSTENYSKSADAYARASTLAPENADYHSARGEALVRAAGGFVTDEAITAFNQTLSLDPQDPRARFFIGLSKDQAGNTKEALETWIDIVKGADPAENWVDDLRQRIYARAEETGIDISDRLPPATQSAQSRTTPGPTAEQIRAAMQQPAEDRQAMIEGMVAGLAAKLDANPNDPEGWIRLIRSRMVLGKPDEARADLIKATAAFADAPETRSKLIAEAAALGVTMN